MEELTFEQAREQIKEAFLELYSKATDWSIFADWFVEWVVDNDFQLKTFDNFVEWLYDYNYDMLVKNSVWGFFFSWGDTSMENLEKFANAFVDDDEIDDFIGWVKEKHAFAD